MRLLLLTHAFNGLTQRLYVELAARGHELSVEFDINDAVTREAVATFRPVAVLLPRRTTTMPEVPTMAEAGQPLVNISPWGGLFGPARLPGDLVERISRDFGTVMRRADVAEQYEKLGLFPTPSTPQVMADVLRQQLAVWDRTMRDLGIARE